MTHQRPHLLSVIMLAATACVSTPSASPPLEADVAITGTSVIDVEGGRVLRDHTVLIKGDRIVSVAPASRTRFTSGARVIDARGKYAIPGLWDMHAHIGGSGNPLLLEMPLFTAHGVTGLRVMGSRPDTNVVNRMRQLQAATAAGSLIGPRILTIATWAVNGEANIPDSLPAFFKARTREEGAQLARHFKERGFDLIKIYNNVSREGYLGLAEEARRLGVSFAGHEPGALSAIELSNAGQRSLEHSRVFLFNCFAGADSLRKGFSRPGSGPAETAMRRRMVDEYDARMCAEVFRTFARNKTYIVPTHGTRRMDAFADDSAFRNDARLKYIPGRQRLAWMLDANGMVARDPSPAGRQAFMDFYTKGLELTLAAHRAGVPVVVGTDAGDTFVFPGSSLHDELGELVKAGFTPAEALRAATLTAAQYFERTADFGTVQQGRYADIVLLDGNPLSDIANARRIHAVIQGGRVHDRMALDSMLVRAERSALPGEQWRLWIAAATGDTAEIRAAVAAGATVDSLDGERNRRALNYAALGNQPAAVRTLLQLGASLNLANPTGFTPLHHAAEAGAVDALAALLEAGADASIPSSQGLLPVETARRRGHAAAVRLLEGRGR